MATPPNSRMFYSRPLMRVKTKAGLSATPEPRIPGKHALNPPIVTVLGGGIAGLTAAHELVERGFYVQVLEKCPDPYNPEQPIVGGMAANQPARIRANIEDLHWELLNLPEDATPVDLKVATWLLEMFAFTRSAWIQTEEPAKFTRNSRLEQEAAGGPPAVADAQAHLKKVQAHLKKVHDTLKECRDRYRDRWIWDLTVRAALCGTISYKDNGVIDEAVAMKVFTVLKGKETNLELAKEIIKHQVSAEFQADRTNKDVPSAAELDSVDKAGGIVDRAIEREFMCVRLRRGHIGSPEVVQAVAKFQKALGDWYDDETPAAVDGAVAGDKGCLFIEVVEQTLPAEHGFHFFPTFYRHVEDTLRRIPILAGDLDIGRNASDNLRPTIRQGLGFSKDDLEEMAKERLAPDDKSAPPKPGAADFVDPSLCDEAKTPKPGGTVVDLLRDRPTSIEGLRDRTDRFVTRLGGTRRDSIWLFAKLLRFMTSCPERRRQQYESVPWSKFLGIVDGGYNVVQPHFSRTMTHQITSAAQALLAFSAAEADARSYGNIAVQLLLDGLSDGSHVDRTLTGPTSEAWLNPWRDYLQRQGVRFFTGGVKELKFEERVNYAGAKPEWELVPVFEGGAPDGMLADDAGIDPSRRPDFYVLALNIEESDRLLSGLDKKIAEDAKLAGLRFGAPAEQAGTVHARDFAAFLDFTKDVRDPAQPTSLKDMTGLQFFFEAKTSIGEGHMYFPYTKWGLSSISQSEFWCQPGGFSDGYMGVLSVGICDTGDFHRPAAGTFWEIMKGAGPSKEQADLDGRRFRIAQHAFEEIKTRIKAKDGLALPRCFHVDRNIDPKGNTSRFLASLYTSKAPRPGRIGGDFCVGDDEIGYSLNYKRWVMCGTFMATHTRITTMESANESGRHAATTILRALKDPDAGMRTGHLGKTAIYIQSLRNRTYNGAAPGHIFDPPDIWDVENIELDDLDMLKRVDRRLLALGLEHLFDIIDLDKKLEHALDAVELYGEGGRGLSEYLGLAVASVDSSLASGLGQGYAERLKEQTADAKGSVQKLSDRLTAPPFGDMKDLLGRIKGVLDNVFK
jgi:hypothetical protein